VLNPIVLYCTVLSCSCRYIVALYSFMRLMGYPAERITILTTYNGQKDLLRDVIEARCARHPLIGRPHKVLLAGGCKGVHAS
jgi:intron-binding protein aquarius